MYRAPVCQTENRQFLGPVWAKTCALHRHADIRLHSNGAPGLHLMMRDGYYLSTYVHCDPLSHAHDICLRHDQNMALWKKTGDQIVLVRYWELERYSGYKHHSFAFMAVAHGQALIGTLLAEVGVTSDDIVAIWGTPGLSTDDDGAFARRHAGFTHHTLSHLYSALLIDTEQFFSGTTVALAVDGGPDNLVDSDFRTLSLYSGAVVRNGHVSLFHVPSPGGLWASLRRRSGMEEGSLMALASASTSAFLGEVAPPPEIWKISDYYDVPTWLDDIAARLDALTQADVGRLFTGFDTRFSEEENRLSMLTKIVDQFSQATMEHTLDRILTEHDVDPSQAVLALVGGFALNCPGNTALMRRFGFAGFQAPPCVNDSGLSLGVGLWRFLDGMGRFDFNLGGAAHGYVNPAPVSAELGIAAPFVASSDLAGLDTIVEDIVREPVIWCQGAAEIGPRALGQRSILGDPTQMATRDALNRIKRRQWWRPVAPIIPEDRLDDWFDAAYPSPYMLHAVAVREDKRDSIPAALHLDGTARVQTVTRADNPRLHALLDAFEARTGVPILCNTSLNDRGEPIVNSYEEALVFGLRRDVSVVCLDDHRITLRDAPDWTNRPLPHRQFRSAFVAPRAEIAEVRERLNPFGLSRTDLMLRAHNKKLQRYDPACPEDARRLERLCAALLRQYGERSDMALLDLWHFVEHGETGPAYEA